MFRYPGAEPAANGKYAWLAGQLCKYRPILPALGLLGVIVLLTLFAPMLAPYDPNHMVLSDKNQDPSPQHLLGTDYLGRDMLSRILVGAQVSLSLSLIVVVISLALGVVVGGLSGYYGGFIDEAMARATDVFTSFPHTIFALVILGAFGSSMINLVMALAIVHWSTYARLMRSQALSIRTREYVSSTITIGAGDLHIVARHVIPNAVAPLIVLAATDLGHVILSIATLNFLGIGLSPDIPEWGGMISAGKEFMFTSPLMTIFPGLAITIVVVVFSMIGDGMRDILDPASEGDIV